jgi:hypothetical protein
MNLKVFSDKALAKYAKTITNGVFAFIQNDRELMHDYLRTVEKNGLDATNRHIDKSVKTKLNLDKVKQRTNDPTSTIIQSHQEFK